MYFETQYSSFAERYVRACGIVSIDDLIELYSRAFPQERPTQEEMSDAAAKLPSRYEQNRGTWIYEGTEYAVASELSDKSVSEDVFCDAHTGGWGLADEPSRALGRAETRRIELVRLHNRLRVKPFDDWSAPWRWNDRATESSDSRELVRCTVSVLSKRTGCRVYKKERDAIARQVEGVIHSISTMDDEHEEDLADYARYLALFAYPLQSYSYRPRKDDPLLADPPKEVLAVLRQIYDTCPLWGLNGWSPREVRKGLTMVQDVTPVEVELQVPVDIYEPIPPLN